MAKERYLPNLAFQPYVAPQQELPVEEFNNLGVVLNQRYDQNIAKWDELDAYMNQVQLSDADQSIKESVLKDTRAVIQDIRKNGNWENGKLQVREVAKRLANDQALAIGQQNFKKAQEQKEIESKMRMQGINLIDFNQDRFNQSTIDPLTGRARVLDYSGTEKLQDYDARRKSLFEGITPDGFDNESSSPRIDEARGMIYQVGSGSSARYISAKKVREIANRNLNNYIESAEGQQELKMLTTSNSMNPVPLSVADAKKQILEGITNTGMTRVFNQTGSKSNVSITASGLNGAAGMTPPENPSLEGITIKKNQSNPVYQSLANKLETGGIKTTPRTSIEGKFAATIFNKTLDLIKNSSNLTAGLPTDEAKVIDRKLTTDENKAFKNIALALGIKKIGDKGNSYSNNDLKKIQDFAKERSNTGISSAIRTFTDEEINKRRTYASNGNYRGRQILDEDFKPLTYDELPDKVREKLESGKTEGIQFQGVFDTDNPFKDIAKASKKFKDTRGFISPEAITIDGKQYIFSSQLSDMRKEDVPTRNLEQDISRAGRTGIPQFLNNGKDKELIVPVGEGLYQIKDTSGNLVFPKSFTKQQLAIYARTYGFNVEE